MPAYPKPVEWRVLAEALRLVAEAVFPARCIGCERRGTPLCDACRRELPFLPDGLCYRCGTRRAARGVCRGCRRLSSALSSVRAAFAYEGAARTAVLRLKFKSGRYLAPLMGEFLRDTLRARPLSAELVVPVPLGPRRSQQRGFNQSELLACEVAYAVGGVVVADALLRQERPPQQTLTAAERLHNLSGAFACPRPRTVYDRRVLLVDDVVTTGATVSACADTLAEAGARWISALAFARDL
jgi:ComF family protein